MRAMEISLTGLDVEWRRLEVIAENLANANSASPVKGPVYQELHLISGPRNDFGAMLDRPGPGNPGLDVDTLAGVAARGVVAGTAPPRLVHEPGNPMANAQGFVAYPAIDHAGQMTKMIETARIYEANIVAMSLAREMYTKAVQLGASR
jgi:flagellar basal-body rod protein FlgC